MKNCPKCGCVTAVIDGRVRDDGLFRRRRKCGCGHRYSTIEMLLPETHHAEELFGWFMEQVT